MLLESPDNTCTIKVKSTESIGTLLNRISNTLSELCMYSKMQTHVTQRDKILCYAAKLGC